MDDARKPDEPEAEPAPAGRSAAPAAAPAAPSRAPEPISEAGSQPNVTFNFPTDERENEPPDRERDRGLSDFVRRAVSAGVGAASRSKDDIMRVAANEMRTWLEHLDVNNELLRALSKMVIEVKTEIRFRPTEDGKLTPETSNDVKIKTPSGGEPPRRG